MVAPIQEWHVYFQGRVQGVGFRYTTMRIAQGMALTGWVRNLTDGRVEILAQGSAVQLDEFVSRVRAAMEDHVADVEQSSSELTASSLRFHDFQVRPTACG